MSDEEPRPYSLGYLTDAQFAAIGRVIVEWSILESAIDPLIWALASLDGETGSAITTHVNLKERLDILETLIGQKLDARALAEFKRIRKIVKNLQGERNYVVHHRWWGVADEPRDTLMRESKKARGEVVRSQKKLQEGDLLVLAAKIHEAHLKMREIFWDRDVVVIEP